MEDLLFARHMNRSLHSASLRSAPVGMTVGVASPPVLAHSRRNEPEETLSHHASRSRQRAWPPCPLHRPRPKPTFPSRPLTLVVPFPAGGPADIFGRNLA